MTSKAPEAEFNTSVHLSHLIALLVTVSFSRVRPKPFEGKSLPGTNFLAIPPLPPQPTLTPLISTQGDVFLHTMGSSALPQGNLWFSCLVKAR